MPNRNDSDVNLFRENHFMYHEQAACTLMRSKEILNEQLTRARTRICQKIAKEYDEVGKSAHEENDDVEKSIMQLTKEAVANSLSLALAAIKIVRKTKTEKIEDDAEIGRFKKPRTTGKAALWRKTR